MWQVRPKQAGLTSGFDFFYRAYKVFTTVESQDCYTDDELHNLCKRVEDFLNTKPCLKCRNPMVASEDKRICASCNSKNGRTYVKSVAGIGGGIRRKGNPVS